MGRNSCCLRIESVDKMPRRKREGKKEKKEKERRSTSAALSSAHTLSFARKNVWHPLFLSLPGEVFKETNRFIKLRVVIPAPSAFYKP